MTLDLIEYLAKKVVDQPESVRVEQTGEREVTYMIHVAPGEEGRIIGRNGRVIQAIRTVARAAPVTKPPPKNQPNNKANKSRKYT